MHEVIENAVGAIRNAIGSAAEVADDEGLLGGLGLALGEIDGWPTKLQQASAERVLEGLADAGVSDTSDEQLDPGASILSGARVPWQILRAPNAAADPGRPEPQDDRP